MENLSDIIILGLVEGITEFLPVSSTGHLILASELLGYDPSRWAVFNIVIQLGAILAIVVLYWRTIWAVLQGMVAGRAESWRFVINVLLGFLPSAVLGLALHRQIEALLGRADVVAWALIAGGLAILWIERRDRDNRIHGIAAMPVRTALGIGLFQCVSMIPGVSRSGATIMGALLLGVERRTAAEYSFFLAIPTMVGATSLELWKNHAELGAQGLSEIAVGFAVAFVTAIVVVRAFMAVITRYGFSPFAWYRIAAGAAALIWLGSA